MACKFCFLAPYNGNSLLVNRFIPPIEIKEYIARNHGLTKLQQVGFSMSLSSPIERKQRFLARMLKSILFTLFLLVFSLSIGIFGYHEFAKLDWIDAFLNASMILSGMGPVAPLETTSAKLFAGFYALYSGGAFLVAIAVILAPLLHYFLKNFELDTKDK